MIARMATPSSSRAPLVAGAALLLAVAAAEALLLGVWWFRDPERARAASPALRGARVAERLGCFGCHGPGGVSGIPNPGAPSGQTPAWAGGTYMMFNEEPGEIREWILDGAPRRLRDDPAYVERRSAQKIWMPAYRDHVSGGDLDDLVAYVESVSAARKPPAGSPEAQGRSLAVEHGCFGCHGPEGRGLVRNPGSLKGYIPPWDSDDYQELVRSPAEFEEWVMRGEIKRFRDDPAAAHFLDHQVIKMPAFDRILSGPDVESLRAYVDWIRSGASHR